MRFTNKSGDDLTKGLWESEAATVRLMRRNAALSTTSRVALVRWAEWAEGDEIRGAIAVVNDARLIFWRSVYGTAERGGRRGVGEERSNPRGSRIAGGKVHSNHGHLLTGWNAGSRIGADVYQAKLASNT